MPLRSALLAALSISALADGLPTLTEPALSPDGSTIAFVSGGDIWTVPASGGEARLLVAHPATESRPQWSPDGRRLMFASTRSGNGDLYLLDLQDNRTTRLTFDDRLEQPGGWSRDGQWFYFASPARNIQRMNDIWRVNVAGGMPQWVTGERYVDQSYPAISPDGDSLAVAARGFDQWWRRGGSHIDQSELWLRERGQYRRLSEPGARDTWPMWDAKGQRLYFVSNRGGQENLWRRSRQGKAEKLTDFRQGRVLWPSIAWDGQSILFERDFRLWRFDIVSRRAQPIEVKLTGSATGPGQEKLAVADQAEELALSPDGRQLAFIARGEIWLAPLEGGSARNLSRTPAAEHQISWAPDGNSLVYVSERDGPGRLYRFDLTSNRETRLTQHGQGDAMPRFSPDGRQLAFMRDGEELRLLDLQTGTETSRWRGLVGRPPVWNDGALTWSPDGRWLAVAAIGERLYRTVQLVPADQGAAVPVSRYASPAMGKRVWYKPDDQGNGNPLLLFTPDGGTLLMRLFPHSDQGQVGAVDLAAPRPVFAGETAAKAGPWQLDRALERNRLLPIGLDVQYFALRPDGRQLAVVATVAGRQNLWLHSLDPTVRDNPTRQLTHSAGSKQFPQFSADGQTVYFLQEGRIQAVGIDGKAKTLQFDAQIEVDFEADKRQLFAQTLQLLREHFYDGQRKEWEVLATRFTPYAHGARTRDELRRTILLLLGELNVSHTGISAPKRDTITETGRLAVNLTSRGGKLLVTGVVPNGPLDLAGGRIGDLLSAIDGQPVDAQTNPDSLLNGKIGLKITLTLQNGEDGTREVTVKPINYADEATLRYREWVEVNRAYVDRHSGGRVGYVHLINMSDEALRQFLLDLDADNQKRDGVVIDVRNNFGGYVDSHVLDVLSRKSHFKVVPRGLPQLPGRAGVGSPALEKLTVLVTNKITLSDGEVFTEGYRSQKLGPIIGEPGAGWVIFTSGRQLVDGSMLRLPFGNVIATRTGEPLEGVSRGVDLPVDLPIGLYGRDTQLDLAIRILLDKTPRK
ncbi:S41 family peptidase [Chitinimonas lacunae]|uniref:Tricorn protease homolog n=1 Tax=Chitinimonas lacunae TaxID=1963018 RepID=A0ABV8MQ52_9NEIS